MKRTRVFLLLAGVVAVAGCRPPASRPSPTVVPVRFDTQSGAAGCYHAGEPPRLPHDQTLWHDHWTVGPTGSTAGGRRDDSHATAAVRLHADAGICLNSSIVSPPVGYGDAAAAGQWVDIIRLRCAGPAPAALRLHVEMVGECSIDLVGHDLHVLLGVTNFDGHRLVDDSYPTPPTAGQVGNRLSCIDVRVSAPMQPGDRPSHHVQTIGVADLRGGGLLADPNTTHDYDGPFPITAPVGWDAYFDVPYSSDLGGYRLNLYATAKVVAAGGSTAAFTGTVRLAGVTLPDGTAVPGPVTFDSGFALAPAR